MIPKVQLKQVHKIFPAVEQTSDHVQAVNDVSLDIFAGEFFALLGPSGCGKSTTLRLIAGFEQPTAGDILINGVPMTGIPAHQRPVNTVFQDYALFPHMTLLKNVMFGLRMEGISSKEAKKRAYEALDLVQLTAAANRKPSEISGGQQQRVALARALVKQPDVLLLDEPLGALDLKLRRQMQLELKALQRELGITFIFVTHDQEEAMTMADRIAVMDNGRVLQVGQASEIYEHPANRFVAEFIGETNILQATLVDFEHDVWRISLAGVPMDISAVETHRPKQNVTVAIRPERIDITSAEIYSPSHNKEDLQGRIADIHYIGTDIRYVVQLDDDQTITVRIQNADPLNQTALTTQERVSLRWDTRYTQVLSA